MRSEFSAIGVNDLDPLAQMYCTLNHFVGLLTGGSGGREQCWGSFERYDLGWCHWLMDWWMNPSVSVASGWGKNSRVRAHLCVHPLLTLCLRGTLTLVPIGADGQSEFLSLPRAIEGWRECRLLSFPIGLPWHNILLTRHSPKPHKGNKCGSTHNLHQIISTFVLSFHFHVHS